MIRSREEREKSEISGRDLQKPFGEFKTVNSILLTKYCSHRTEISTKDIVTRSICDLILTFCIFFGMFHKLHTAFVYLPNH